MRIVGDHLLDTAFQQGNDKDCDLFARSAFNRYYYAVYLIVKDKLSVINPKWGEISHKNLPEVLTGQVIRKIKNDVKKKVRNDVFKPHEGENIKQQVIHSANELSNLLKNAYRIRVIADYEPEKKVKVIKNAIQLDGEKASDAKRWKNDAETFTISILEAYKDVGLITD